MDGINAELHFYILLLGTCMIGEQIIVRILAGKMQADSYPEEAYWSIFSCQFFAFSFIIS